MWDVRECLTFTSILQKDIFDHEVLTKALRMTISVSGSKFRRSRNPMVSFIFTYDLDLSRSWPLQNVILGHISVTNVQNDVNF